MHAEPSDNATNVLSGFSASPGIVIGQAYRFEKTAFVAQEASIDADDVEEELRRFERAVSSSERDLRKIAGVARDQLGTESAHLFEAQALMLRDPTFESEVKAEISGRLITADFSVQSIMERHRSRLEASSSQYLRERAHDMADVQMRLVRHLQQGRVLSRIDEKRVVVASALSAADLVLFTRQNLLGCVLDYGGETSHVAIMARALEIPVVAGLDGRTNTIENEAALIVDGLSGEVVVEPTDEQLAHYEEKRARYQRSLEEAAATAEIPAETLDGVSILLQANLEFEEELPHLAASGARGIGLFRTEILFLSQAPAPEEEEQLAAYRRIVERVSPDVTTFRLLDLGGDKTEALARAERNPDLGWRGVRVLLDTPDLLLPQLRALIRASAYGKIRILLPMVTSTSELAEMRLWKRRVEDELRQEGIPFDDDIPLGAMVEIPGAALRSGHLAETADFLSIGTNDLTQYTLAVDRSNELVAHRYSSLHPSVLELVKRTIGAGEAAGTSTSLCGELGGFAPATPILLGLGVREISISPISLPAVKRAIRRLRIDECEVLADKCLEAAESDEVLDILDQWLAERPELAPET